MKYLPVLLIALCCNVITFAQSKPAFNPADIDIPYQKYVLENGLRLIVHEDHKAPIVAVNVWYHVGSKNEKLGKSGFAHLFEHLMFNGSENFNDDYFQALEKIGGTDLNGTTNNDRTNYFQNVPVAAFDQVLFLESDRMGHLLGAIDQAKLDEQRGVVQNEKRQGENQPYGKQWDLITKAMYPPGHPYSWTVIGEMEDLNAASLEDVQEWFKTYYGAANAVVVVAGAIKADEAYRKVQQYFGDIPSGPALTRPAVNIPVRTNDTRETYQDRVPEARIVQVWNTPQWGTREAVMLDLATDVLSSGKNSRLYKKLVYEDQTASTANAFVWPKEISGNVILQANVKSGYEVEVVEQTINDIMAEFIKNGPTVEELDRMKAQYFANFVKGLERIGGFGGKSDILAENEVYGRSPDYYKKILQWVAKATPEDVRQAAQKWLTQGKYTQICTPFPDFKTTPTTVDRSKGLPPIGEPAAAQFPSIRKATLKNGMQVVLAPRAGVPTVAMNMVFDAGYSADYTGKPGTATLAMNMMDEGTKTRNTLEINEQLQVLGASLGTGADLDASYVSMNTLKPSLDASLDLFADVILNPAFPKDEFDRQKNQRLAQIQREKASPVSMAFRAMPKIFFGAGHPYSTPGTGFEESVQNMTREDLVQYYNTWIKPNNATLVVVGDISMEELLPKLEQRFNSWQKGNTPKKNIAAAKSANEIKGKLYLMDRPEAQQSVVIAGHLIDPYGKISEIAKTTAINVLGGEFTSRVNMNLREDKHWSYGAFTFVNEAKGNRPLITYAPVQTDKTKESVEEIIKELTGYVGDNPVTKEEFEKTTQNTILQLPGQWETSAAVLGSLVTQVKYGLPDNYYQTYDSKVRNLSLEEVRQVSRKLVRPDDLTFLVVGDQGKILSGLQELGFKEIIIIDADGNPIQDAKKAKP